MLGSKAARIDLAGSQLYSAESHTLRNDASENNSRRRALIGRFPRRTLIHVGCAVLLVHGEAGVLVHLHTLLVRPVLLVSLTHTERWN